MIDAHKFANQNDPSAATWEKENHPDAAQSQLQASNEECMSLTPQIC